MHIGLEEYRAIKRISKRDADYDTFRKEALVLKELRHPGIPMIYDLEEDSEFFYLIEEYLEGYSLYALIVNQGPIQEAEAVRYGMQVCVLVAYTILIMLQAAGGQILPQSDSAQWAARLLNSMLLTVCWTKGPTFMPLVQSSVL